MSKHAMVIMKFCYSLAKCLKGKNGNPKRSPALFFCLLSFVFCLLFSAPAYAALSVDITTGGNWAIGAIKSSGVIETTDDTWEITNDGDEVSDIYIKVDGTTWNPGATASAETFILKHDVSGSWSDAITNSGNGILLTRYLAASGTKPFDLQFTAPTSSAVEGTQQTLTVTLTAVTWACGSIIQDIDLNTYNTVFIGTQCWMKENLNVTKNPSGGAITRYCYDGDTDCSAGYGGLYTWDTAMNGSILDCEQGICPDGWRIPRDTELKTLVESQATPGCEASTGWQCDPAGARLAGNAALWNDGVLDGHTNFGESGFDTLPAGYRDTVGSFSNRGTSTNFWSSLESGENAWERHLSSGYSTVDRSTSDKAYGFSVRCLQATLLTWTGVNLHSDASCAAIGGTVYDTGSTGTICRVPSATVPVGWTQAANWQRYSVATWGGDWCGNHLSTGPTVFSNVSSEVLSNSVVVTGQQQCANSCSIYPHWWNTCNGLCDTPGSEVCLGTTVLTVNNSSTYRTEIGVY
ncbi:MAG: hypothetical protein KAR13_04820 [Desulfobulbaceae bacterium]|nr:hypothetical protein [Desulfobulbaceae bacterium]